MYIPSLIFSFFLIKLRAAYQVFKRLTGNIFASYPFASDSGSGSGSGNPGWSALEYVPKLLKKKKKKKEEEENKHKHKHMGNETTKLVNELVGTYEQSYACTNIYYDSI